MQFPSMSLQSVSEGREEIESKCSREQSEEEERLKFPSLSTQNILKKETKKRPPNFYIIYMPLNYVVDYRIPFPGGWSTF